MHGSIMSRSPYLPDLRPFVRFLPVTHLLLLLLEHLIRVVTRDAPEVGSHFQIGVRVSRLPSLARPPHELSRVKEPITVIDQGRRHSVVELEEARVRPDSGA